ncbi:MAG: DNA-processing protein DprA [Deltaproteobacteria bacterium]|nr:DNA-processing protein DprA [Deltaproteobacteria bacterium]
MSQPDAPEDWLALHLVPGLGNLSFKKLLEKFGNPAQILGAPVSELLEVGGLRKEVARRISRKEFSLSPSKVMRSIKEMEAGMVIYPDPGYPDILREIHDPPMVLYLRGCDIPKRASFVAVVGSRSPTPYGTRVAENIAQGLARRGVGVVSGLARGIDSAAHWGCLGGHGFTIAVLGTGIDIVYPASNRKLFGEITMKGAVITEFPPGTPPEPKNFPIRNRVISGLSKAVVVVEATMNSGSLITASVALEQGREVYAVPGSVQSFKSRGCHFLIKQGAKLVENADDVLDELGLNYPFAIKNDTFKTAPSLPVEESEQKIYDLIGDYPIHIDEIAREGNIEPSAVSAVLMRMELRGIIRQLPGKYFVR